jgi:adenylosuccinate lyase
LDLVENGISREDAYRMVQTHAMRSWKEGLDFRQQILSDPAITTRVPKAQLNRAFNLARQLKNVDKIFSRVFDKKPSKTTTAPKKKKKRTR